MPSLKEIRARINSVASTEKITNAMKMVSAAKLKKSEGITLSFLPYRNKLNEALSNYLSSLEETVNIPLAEKRSPKKVVLIAFSSSSGLCGVYNSNAIKLLRTTYDDYTARLGKDNVEVVLFGKKLNDYAKKAGIPVTDAREGLSEQLSYEMAAKLSDAMVERFLNHDIDEVVMVYNHFKNAGVQTPVYETVLPLATDTLAPGKSYDYIVEPTKEDFLNALVPKVVRTKFYSIMLDTFTAEHGARMTAMHIANDNANTLLQELRIQYNKARQNVITNELIDIVGGAEALNN
ncbi:MAG: ATP synthase F1 subunit gamma [Bacteroidales bacterium]|nr:ATP synthase F1 subunit gamma [Bacteroidales bacterium]MBQ5959018.1 ATP synthase F1 subunit gamma [Bacteroidales bacterium]